MESRQGMTEESVDAKAERVIAEIPSYTLKLNARGTWYKMCFDLPEEPAEEYPVWPPVLPEEIGAEVEGGEVQDYRIDWNDEFAQNIMDVDDPTGIWDMMLPQYNAQPKTNIMLGFEDPLFCYQDLF